MKARAWIENGVIRCLSQMCEVGGVPCPRLRYCYEADVTIIGETPGSNVGGTIELIVDKTVDWRMKSDDGNADLCETVNVAIGPDRRVEMLDRLAETVRVCRNANYEARKDLEDEIDSLLRELNAGERE